MSRKWIFVLLIIGLNLIQSCSSSGDKPEVPDTGHIDVKDVSFIRFDRLVSGMDTSDIEGSYKALLREHPVFTDLYFKRLLGIPAEDRDSFYGVIGDYITADAIVALNDTIESVYSDTEALENEFREAFRLLKYYFPEADMPNVYFFCSEFGYQTIIFSDLEKDGIGVGLDLFLGADFDYKKLDPRNPAFSEYLTRSYNRDHIVRKVLSLILDDHLGQANGKRFIDLVIHNGKRLYVMDRLLPFHHDTIVFEYGQESWNWLQQNELDIWSFFLDKELMYETNHLKIDKYVNPSPNAPGMPSEAPGRTGSYIGLRVVESYMDRHPETSLLELAQMHDAQKLMENSKYKPKRR